MRIHNNIFKSFIFEYSIFLIVINFIIFIGFFSNLNNYIQNHKNIIKTSIEELGDIDPEYICKLTHCESIEIYLNDNTIRIYKHLQENDRLRFYKNKNIKQLNKHILIKLKNYILYKDYTLYFVEETYNIHIISYTEGLITQFIDLLIYLNISFSIVFLITFIYIELQNYKFRSLNVRTTNRSLQETNMQLLTENTHHELNTPLAIVGGLIKNTDVNLTSMGINHSFDQIYVSLDQMRVVLERMSNFKQLKYSNGNKSLYDIISYCSNSMSIFKFKNFEINIDENLKHYSSSKMANGDILNIISQHLKNSLEAKSSRINVAGIYDDKKNIISIYIVDNGTGIRNKFGNILEKDEYNVIFDAYYSTKDKDGNPLYDTRIDDKNCYIIKWYLYLKMKFKIYLESTGSTNELRGIGLYLNKLHMREIGGDVELEETSTEGTVFKIKIPVKIKEN